MYGPTSTAGAAVPAPSAAAASPATAGAGAAPALAESTPAPAAPAELQRAAGEHGTRHGAKGAMDRRRKAEWVRAVVC